MKTKRLTTIRSAANVCFVHFSPYSYHLLCFGSTDYRTYCYDLRNISTPLCSLNGQDTTVSFMKLLDHGTLISASTDNTLKRWDLNKVAHSSCSTTTNSCILTFKGLIDFCLKFSLFYLFVMDTLKETMLQRRSSRP